MGAMQLKVLSDAELETIRERTLDVLEKVGIKITHTEALRKLAKAGAKVNEASGIARLPRSMVKELLALAPSTVTQTGLSGEVVTAGGDSRTYVSLILDPFIVDYEQGLRRPVLEDVRRNVIVGESIDRISGMMRMQYPVSDVPGPDSYYKTMEVFLSHLTKHCYCYPTSEENCREWMDVLAVIADAAGLDAEAAPLASVAMANTSPLQIHGPNVEIMKMALQRGYPVTGTVSPMAGTTSPYSVAGTLLMANAEAIATVLLLQTYKPGYPTYFGFGPSVTEMRRAHDLYYKAEKMLFKVAATQLGKSYGLPIKGEAGGSGSWRPDVQNGAESMAYLLASHAGGQNIISGLGSFHNAMGMSSEQIIMQVGLIDMAQYLSRGIGFDEKRLGLDAIERVGPGGNFLTDDLTLDLMRSEEFFNSPYFDLSGGYESDAPGMHEIAHQKVEQMLAEYQPEVPGAVREAVERFFASKYQDKKNAAAG